MPALAVETFVPFRCHWYVRFVPVATTFNDKFCPVHSMVVACGCVVKFGAAFTLMDCGVVVWLGAQAPVTTQVYDAVLISCAAVTA